MHYVNKRKIASQNKPNLAKCAPNIEKVDNSIYNLKGKLANFISYKQQMKINQKMNYKWHPILENKQIYLSIKIYVVYCYKINKKI